MTSDGERRSRLIGIGLMTFSTFIFGFSNVLAKHLTTQYPIGEALVIRSGFALLLLLPFVRPRDLWALRHSDLGLHVVRMVLAGIEIACFYWAVSLLQLADISTFYLSAPVMLTAISAVVLREKVGPARWLATLLGFAGVLVALRPTSGALSAPAMVGLLGSLLYAIFLAVTRRLRGTPGVTMVLLQLIALTIAGAVTVPFAWQAPDLGGFALMAGVGVIGITGYFCVNRALQLAPASVIAPFQYLSIIWSVVLGYLAFDDVPGVATLAGAGLIVAAGALILYLERREQGMRDNG
ncbi:MAG: DMT family transporter [Alphaproteobacteria bacterium]|nr:DMT family transporter [Alphaproteobacteria bacterium]